ncbi:MAG: phage holin family protein, partial [Acidobacteriota bacterium]
TLLLAGLVLGIINLFIKPIVVLVSLPVILLSLGLFYFIINGLMLWLVSMFIPQFHMEGILAFLLGSVLFTCLNMVVGWILPKKKRDSD